MDMKVTILVEMDGEKREITCDNCYATFKAGDEIGYIWQISPSRLAKLLAQDKNIRANWDDLVQAVSILARLVEEMGGMKQ